MGSSKMKWLTRYRPRPLSQQYWAQDTNKAAAMKLVWCYFLHINTSDDVIIKEGQVTNVLRFAMKPILREKFLCK